MCHRMDDDLYIIGNKQFLANMLNGVLFLGADTRVPAPHYVNEHVMVTHAVNVTKLFEDPKVHST